MFSVETLPIPTIHALIVGIDRYPKYHNLTGAVNDARRFRQFVRNYLFAKESNIITLLDEAASRQAILDEFEGLISNENITRDDPIIVYFAGHGSRVEKPKEWVDWPTVTQTIEIIFPSDFDPAADGTESEVGQGIPDRTVTALLHQLSQKRGDNITLILDCCRSKSNPGDARDETRGTAKFPKISSYCDERIVKQLRTHRSSSRQGFWGKHHSSYVLLTACRINEQAGEARSSRHGIFTRELIRVLRQMDINRLTYTSLMNQLRMPIWQTPQWEGQNTRRRLFNKWRPGANPEYITGTKRTSPDKGEPPTYVLHAGEMHGIVPGSTYAIHLVDIDEDDSPAFNPKLCDAIVENVGSSVSQLKLLVDMTKPPHMPPVFYGKCVTEGPAQLLVVYCNRPIWFNSIIHPNTHTDLGFTLISPRSNPQSLDPKLADLRIIRKRADKHVYFRGKKGTVVSESIGSGYKALSFEQAERKLKDVIKAAICFRRRLSRQQGLARNREIEIKLKMKVWLELKELDPVTAKPIGGNLLLLANSGAQAPRQDTATESVLADRTMDDLTVTLRTGRSYCVLIHNDSDIPLYAYAESFEPKILKIGCGGPALVEVPPEESILRPGSGEAGTSLVTFELAEGATRGIGFIKVYLSPSNQNFKGFMQPSPYTFPGLDPSNVSSNAKDQRNEGNIVGDAWVARTIVVKQVSEEGSSSAQVDPPRSRNRHSRRAALREELRNAAQEIKLLMHRLEVARLISEIADTQIRFTQSDSPLTTRRTRKRQNPPHNNPRKPPCHEQPHIPRKNPRNSPRFRIFQPNQARFMQN
ncbi:hypothetical protein BDN72DRAFT_848644 [Pluteus cervinus]|uniref:Uncharacterized protein n=1 Tax=Pluteus cervinus TaxID=181527 RepID=A0ACD3AAW9_9AGAR|nr:hypothetical protein BDN72DRAFT_848644 [Pluteus cervinus]